MDSVWQAVDSLYEASLDPDLWDDALRSVVELLGGRGATFEVHRRDAGELSFFRHLEMPEDGVERYLAHFHRICPRLPSPDAPAGNVDYDYKFLSETEIRRHEFYQDFLIPDAYRYFLSGTLANDETEFTIFCVHFGLGRGHPEQREIRLLRRLMPHLKRAVDLHLALGCASRRVAEMERAVEALNHGVILVDAAGRVVYANDAGQRLMGPLGEHGRLVVRDRRDNARLQGLLRAAMAAHAGDVRHSGGQMFVGRNTGRPRVVSVAPFPSLRRWHWLEQTERVVAVVLVKDAARAPEVDEAVLIDNFGLTPAEARLAQALLGGARLPEYAERVGISHNTARSQLAQVRAKLGRASQVEVVSMLARLSR